MRFTPGLVFGIVLTGAGVMLMMDRLGMTDVRELARFWPVILILFGASLVSQAVQGAGWCGAAPTAAAEAGGPDRLVRPRRTGRAGGFWLIVLLVLGSIFLSETYGRRLQVADRLDDPAVGNLKVFALMGEDHRQSFATDFEGAQMTTVMGQSRLDLRDAILAPGEEAVVEVFGMMGEVQLVVPDGWLVDIRTRPVMGAVRDLRFNRNRVVGPPSEARAGSEDAPVETAKPLDPPRVIVRGFIMMGQLEIRSS